MTLHASLAGSGVRAPAQRSLGPAYQFETGRLLGRCWTPADAPAYRAAIDDNDQHLRPYIPWMREEPKPLEATLENKSTADKTAAAKTFKLKIELVAPKG